jgi:hypothetical protein
MAKKKLLMVAFMVFIPAFVAARDTLWTVVGAGPAGIAVVGLLIDLGIDAKSITWIDPEFNVGRLGNYYYNVPGNAHTKMYIDFLQACRSFQQCAPTAIDELKKLDLMTAYPLHVIIDPLRDITECFKRQVVPVQGKINALHFENNRWHIGIDAGAHSLTISSYYVALATGSHPIEYDYPCQQVIPLDLALDKDLLAKQVRPEDTVALVGSAHSAILILRFLSELPVGRIINFYKKPIVYTADMGTWIQNQEAGLKGSTAQWAKNVLEKNPPVNILRIFNTAEALDAWLPICNKIIYAVGFERNDLPPINGSQELIYDDISGVIAPRLFGIGIAFPEKFTYPDGNIEHRVGLKFFMEYAQRVVPQWIVSRRAATRLASFDSLFDINLL